MYSVKVDQVLTRSGFPIQKSPDQGLFSNSPKLIAAYHVFHRLLAPRHPPFALSSLATNCIYLKYAERFSESKSKLSKIIFSTAHTFYSL
jgi:hypothetical protein